MIALPMLPNVAKRSRWRYGSSVTVNPVADLGRSRNNRRTSAHHLIAGAFFVPVMSLYGGGCARDTFGCAGFLLSRSANLRTVATSHRLAATGGSSSTIGVPPMHTRNPSSHASAWKARALSALRSNSSLSVRLARYNAAMARARALEFPEVPHA